MSFTGHPNFTLCRQPLKLVIDVLLSFTPFSPINIFCFSLNEKLSSLFKIFRKFILSGGDDSNPNPIFPIAPQWVDNLIYIGREIIGVEYLKEKDEDLTEVS